MPTLTGPTTPVLAFTGTATPIRVPATSGVMEVDDGPYVASGRDQIDVQVMVLDRYRNRLSELRPVTVKPVPFSRQSIPVRTVVWPSDAQGGDKLVDFDRERFQDRARELQVWRDGRLVCGGPVVHQERDASGMVTTTFTDHRQYLADRTVGSADRTNWLRNPDAEMGTYYWTAVNAAVEVVDTLIGPAPRAFKATGVAFDSGIYQIRRLPDSDTGNNVTISYWYKLASDVNFPAFGIGVQAKVFVDGQEDVSLRNQAFIETRGPWTRLEVGAHQPAGATVEVEVRLWVPKAGAILWTAGQVVYRENVSVEAGGDQSELVAALLRTNSTEGGHGWEVDATLSGETFDDGFAYNDYEAPNYFDAVQDWSHTVDCYPTLPSASRVKWLVGPPSDAVALTLTPETATNIKTSQDASEVASYVRYRGDSTGVAREEGAAFDPGVADGLRIDRVEDAPNGTSPRDLDAGARAFLGRYHRAVMHTEAASAHDGYMRASGHLVHSLRPGQVIETVAPIAGGVTATVRQRIEDMVWDPQSDTLTFTDLGEVL